MTDIDKNMLERIVREVIMEQMTKGKADTKTVDPSGVLSIKLPQLDVSEEDRLDTGKAGDVV